jgi:hypothetical protein
MYNGEWNGLVPHGRGVMTRLWGARVPDAKRRECGTRRCFNLALVTLCVGMCEKMQYWMENMLTLRTLMTFRLGRGS